jgi:hypothetical protein
MIEPIMFFGIGVLFATLIGVAVIPLVHDRAVRLTKRRLESSIPQSMAEIQTDKDLLRAEFAMSARRLETGVEQLKEQTTSQIAELGRKSDVIKPLRIEREAQTVEIIALKKEVESLQEQLASVGKELKTAEYQRHESDVVSLVPKDWPRAEPARVRADGDRDVVSLAMERPTTEEARPSGLARASGISALQAEPSIHVSPDDQIAHERRTVGGRNLRRLFIVALMGIGATFAWRSYSDDAKEMVRTWAPPVSRLLSVSTEKSPPVPASAAAVPPAPVAQQLVEQHTAKQEQDVATPQAGEQDKKQKLSSADPQSRANLTPFPETKPTTIPGWTLLEVIDGRAVVQGPHGVWRVARGDTVPGVGRVNSIVRWGNRWIVATSSGLISTP